MQMRIPPPLARLLKPIIYLLNPLLESSIWMPWPPESDFQDLARLLNPIISILNPLTYHFLNKSLAGPVSAKVATARSEIRR